MTMNCPKCGTNLPNDARFCSVCGSNLIGMAGAGAAPPPPAITQARAAAYTLTLMAEAVDVATVTKFCIREPLRWPL